MSEVSLAREWFLEWAPDPPILGPATALLMTMIDEEPERAWSFILLLIEHAPNEQALGWVGAGPLEDLLASHGAGLIARVEDLASRDRRFRSCLSHVWGQNRIEPDTYRRMRRADGRNGS
jgi:hypothetical protein